MSASSYMMHVHCPFTRWCLAPLVVPASPRRLSHWHHTPMSLYPSRVHLFTPLFQHRTCVMPSAICLHALLPVSGPFAIFLRCMLICLTPSFSISRCLQYITSLFLAWFFTSVFSLVPPTCLLVSQLHWLFVLLDCKYSSTS